MMNQHMFRDLICRTGIFDEVNVNGDVCIDGDLKVKGSTTTLEINNLEAIEELKKRMDELEKRNELLEKIVTKLQFHPDSPFVKEVADEWNLLWHDK